VLLYRGQEYTTSHAMALEHLPKHENNGLD
jgi:hypothetical protein